jgi:uncharacterized protein (DUF488 family)
MSNKVIYTLGSSTRSWEQFINLLNSYRIKTLIDVRRFPKSKFQHFHKEFLTKHLPAEGIRYVYLGEELGGYRGGYERHMESEGFRSGLGMLQAIASAQVAGIMCAERVPWRCHRMAISYALERLGWNVIHIIESDRLWRPKWCQD